MIVPVPMRLRAAVGVRLARHAAMGGDENGGGMASISCSVRRVIWAITRFLRLVQLAGISGVRVAARLVALLAVPLLAAPCATQIADRLRRSGGIADGGAGPVELLATRC